MRIDDRLIHGQVTVAWGAWLEPTEIVLVNEEVANTEWKRELYSTTDTLGSAVSVVTIEEFLTGLREARWDREKALVVVETPSDLREMTRGGLSLPSANVGGMHFSEGKREILPYVYVDDDDVMAMLDLIDSGVRLEAQDVPQTQPVDLEPALRRLRPRTDADATEECGH